MKRLFSYFAKIFIVPVVSVFIKVIKGRENIPSHSSFIVASNHLDGWDHYFIGFVLKERLKDIHFIGAMEDFKTLFLSGLLYWLSDTIIIHRNRTKRRKLISKVLKYLHSGSIIVIYPEGDTNSDKVLLRGRTGIADFVLESRFPVLPIGIRKLNNCRKRIIRVGKPFYFIEEIEKAKKIKHDRDSYNIFLREITDKIMREISKLSGKPYPY